MADENATRELESMADEIFELTKIASAARSRGKTGDPEELSEAEFLTLDVIAQHDSLTVGDIQKRIGVLPAQMSRIIRSLEGKGGEGFVRCSINPGDRRKIDVSISRTGRTAHRAYRAARRHMTMEILRNLVPDDRIQFMRILGLIRNRIAKRPNGTA